MMLSHWLGSTGRLVLVWDKTLLNLRLFAVCHSLIKAMWPENKLVDSFSHYMYMNKASLA